MSAACRVKHFNMKMFRPPMDVVKVGDNDNELCNEQ